MRSEKKIKKSRAVCVLGMHRSGTSTVARLVNLLGAYVGEECDLLPPAPDNPEGFWELKEIVLFHDRLLEHFKKNWQTVLPPVENWHRTKEIMPFREELASLVKKYFSRHEFWAWKDPRTSILLPLWKDVLKEMGIELSCIFVVRNPLDTAKSLMTREKFPYEKSYGIWFNYNLLAIRGIMDVPHVLTFYDDFLENWEPELKRCAVKAGIPWPKEMTHIKEKIASFIKPEFRHSASTDDDLREEKVPQPVIELYDFFRSMLGPSIIPDADCYAKIDRLYNEFLAYCSFFQYDSDMLWMKEEWLKDYTRQLTDKEKALNEELAIRNSLLSEKESLLSRIDSIESENESLKSERESLMMVNDALLKKSNSLESENESLKSGRESLMMVNDALLKKSNSLESENESLKSGRESLMMVNDALLKKSNSLESENESLKSGRESLMMVNDALLKKSNSLESEKEVLEVTKAELVHIINLLESEIAAVRYEKEKIEKYSINAILPLGSRRREAVKSLLKPLRRTSKPQDQATSKTEHMEGIAAVEQPITEALKPRYFGVCRDGLISSRFEWTGDTATSVAIPLSVNRPITGRFRVPYNGFSEINVLVATYDRVNTCSVILELFEEDGRSDAPAARMDLPASELKNNEFLRFSFQPIGDSASKWYLLRVSSNDCIEGNTIAVWVSVPLDEPEDLKASNISKIIYEPTPGQSNYYLVNIDKLRKFLGRTDIEDIYVVIAVEDGLISALPEGVTQIISSLESSGIKASVVPMSRALDFMLNPSRHVIAVFYETLWNRELEETIRMLRLNFIITIFVSLNEIFSEDFQGLRKASERCDFFASPDSAIVESSIRAGRKAFPLTGNEVPMIIQMYAVMKLPKINIVSVLYRKEKEILHYLESFSRQSYPGEFEMIFVDDKSPDNSTALVKDFIAQKGDGCGFKIHIIKNKENLGNCLSRNIGIEKASGDIVVIIDSDCVVNRDFIAAHAAAHSLRDCEVVIGPFNIETNGRDPLEAISEYETTPEKVLAECNLQDPVNRQSFVNCITRNFSVRRDFIDGYLFDPLFSYSKDPASGFGWEDVEMGYRLFKSGARIKFIPDAFSLHISHESSADERTKPLRSLLNYRRLLEKHPDIIFEARRWAVDTYQKICAWVEGSGLPVNADRQALDIIFSRFIPQPFYIGSKRGLKILSYRWHCPHQYELYKLPHDFTLAAGLGTGFTNSWEYGQRPLRENVTIKNISEINPRNFDLAILHFDENVLFPGNSNGVLSDEWGASFKRMRSSLDIPMVAVCHGTPQFYGQYNSACLESELLQPIEAQREMLVKYMEGITVICNSYQAAREWRFGNSRVIWHGFDPAEFPPSVDGRGVLTLGKAMKERPHYRGYSLFQQVYSGIPAEFEPGSLSVPEPDILYGIDNRYAFAKFRNYADNIRKYAIYFNPTLRSPMPRSRGEAMMCGLVSVSADNHDVNLFVKNGTNGFYSNAAEELREYLVYLLRNPEKCAKIGQESRKLASDVFNHDRYLGEWEVLISDTIGSSRKQVL